jgi:surface polysaccharide O-acyltransferase-like enzyme
VRAQDWGGAVAETAGRAQRRAEHIYPVDMVRVLTFACVIAVHTISTVNPIDSRAWGGAAMLLHFTREAFFVLTAFVLTSRYPMGPGRAVPFWRRRFLLVGVPYLVWSLVYSGIGLAAAPRSPGASVDVVLYNLATGQAWFHLYFLLVSLQFYLLFPLFTRLLQATREHHIGLVATSALVQVLLDLWMHDPAPTGVKSDYLHFAGSYLVSYQFYLVLGGVAAMHRQQIDAWVRRQHRAVIAFAALAGALAEGRYLWAIEHGGNAVYDTDVFQVVIIPWSVAVVALFYLVGTFWADRRGPGPKSRMVERASDRSFGVFLVHPVILWALTAAGPSSPAAHLPAPLSTLAVYLVAVCGSLVFVELIRRTPVSLVLTGKRRARRRPATSAAVPAPRRIPAPVPDPR